MPPGMRWEFTMRAIAMGMILFALGVRERRAPTPIGN